MVYGEYSFTVVFMAFINPQTQLWGPTVQYILYLIYHAYLSDARSDPGYLLLVMWAQQQIQYFPPLQKHPNIAVLAKIPIASPFFSVDFF